MASCPPSWRTQRAPACLLASTPAALLPACRDGKLYLRVDWTPEQLADYDTSAWLNPKVDASASPEAMQPTIELIKVIPA